VEMDIVEPVCQPGSRPPRAAFAGQLVIVAGLVLAVGACNSTPPTVTPVPPTVDASAPPTVDPNSQPLKVTVLNTEVAPGSERMEFRVQDKDGAEVTDGDMQVTMYRILGGTGQAAKAASGPAVYFGSGQPGGGEWVVYTDYDSSGTWGFEVNMDHPTRGKGNARVNVEVSAKPHTPKVGDKAPSGDTPKVAAGGDLKAVTSDPSPDPELYQMSVADAIASGKPTVVYFGSPAHCATAICTASLASLKTVKEQYRGKVNFIHVETRDLANPSQLSAANKAWGLPSEPWTFVLDKAGRINTRMEGGLDPTELALVLKQQLGVQ
jgi:hypothetical protein